MNVSTSPANQPTTPTLEYVGPAILLLRPRTEMTQTKPSTFGKWLICCGVAIIFGPLAIFAFVSTFPSFFGDNTVLFWHYLSAFGLIIYVPVGPIVIVIGLLIQAK